MKEISIFRPNDEAHRAFGDALRRARGAGVNIIALDSAVTPDTLTPDSLISIEL